MKPTTAPILFLLVVVSAALLWLPPLDSSLWLDEFDTYVTAKDGVFASIERNLLAHPQCSMLYNALIALVIGVFGSSEVALRFPSVLATIVAAMYLFRIGAKLVDRETGLLACVVFVALRDVSFAAVDARSYAFATAACVASSYYFLRFVELPRSSDASDRRPEHGAVPQSRRRDGIAYAVTAALTVHFHYVFGLALLAHALMLALLIARRELVVAPRDMGVAVLVFVLAVLPGVAPFLATVSARDAISYAPPHVLANLLGVWARPELAASIVPLLLLRIALGKNVSFSLPPLDAAAWLLLVAWTVLPPTIVFLVSELTSVQMFLTRYFLCAQAGLALLVAVLLRGFDPPGLRAGAATVFALLAIFADSRDTHLLEDWREMSAALRAEIGDDTPVLLNAGFVEAGNVDWLTLPADDDRKQFLLAPSSYYPMRGVVSVLPYRISDDTRDYMERVLVPSLEGVERFAAVARQRRHPWIRAWFDGRYGAHGYEAREIYASSSLYAVLYERESP
jgi:uncharacterized membrane protein